jgi:hypothetical protein
MKTNKKALSLIMLSASFALACEQEAFVEGPVNFESEGAQQVRLRACQQDWDIGARKGSAEETQNATLLWSVSPYQILVPKTGRGFAKLNIDAPHYDWLVYTTSDVQLDAIDGPPLTYNGPVEECPELDLVEYGAHQEDRRYWMMQLDAQNSTHVKFYSGLAATDHSDPEEAGHAGHLLDGDEHAPGHGGH